MSYQLCLETVSENTTPSKPNTIMQAASTDIYCATSLQYEEREVIDIKQVSVLPHYS